MAKVNVKTPDGQKVMLNQDKLWRQCVDVDEAVFADCFSREKKKKNSLRAKRFRQHWEIKHEDKMNSDKMHKDANWMGGHSLSTQRYNVQGAVLGRSCESKLENSVTMLPQWPTATLSYNSQKDFDLRLQEEEDTGTSIQPKIQEAFIVIPTTKLYK